MAIAEMTRRGDSETEEEVEDMFLDMETEERKCKWEATIGTCFFFLNTFTFLPNECAILIDLLYLW